MVNVEDQNLVRERNMFGNEVLETASNHKRNEHKLLFFVEETKPWFKKSVMFGQTLKMN